MIRDTESFVHAVFHHLFKNHPKPYLLFQCADDFPIVAANHRYLSITGSQERDLVGHSLRDVFPEHIQGRSYVRGNDLHASLQRVQRLHASDTISPSLYKAGLQVVSDCDESQMRFWYSINVPIFDSSQKHVLYILHQLEEFTENVTVSTSHANKPNLLSLLMNALRVSEKRYETIINACMDAFICVDQSQRIVIFNPAAESMFRCSAENALGTHIERFIPTQFRFANREHIREFLNSGVTYRSMGNLPQLSGLRADGEEFPIEASISVVDAKEKFSAVIVRDISVRAQATNALAEREEQLRFVTESANVGCWDWDIAANRTEWSDRCKQMFGRPIDTEMNHARFLEIVHPEDREQTREKVQSALAGTGHYDNEYRILWPDGSIHWIYSRGQVKFGSSHAPQRMGGIAIDITVRKQMEEALRHQAEIDTLTGLPNRAAIFRSIEHLIAGADRGHYCIAFLYIDLDRFKPINDTYGHNVGDALLKEVARRLKTCIRGEDVVARLGGDEFLAVLSHIHYENDAAKVANFILQTLDHPYRIDGLELQVSPSIGISLFPKDATDVDELVNYADTAMYHVKESGRNSFQFYRHELNARFNEATRIESRLKIGMEQHEFELYFQPVMEFKTRKPIAAEALIRWPIMNCGPEIFIPVAEAAGFMPTLGRWVIEETCRIRREWYDAEIPAFPVSVNISASQVRRHDFADIILTLIEQAGLTTQDITIEVTESAVMQNIEMSALFLKKIQDKGVRVALDNFGTGYSSMNYLNRLSIDTLKLHHAFVQQIDQGEHSGSAIVDAIMCLARALKIDVIAEGVESENVIRFLRARHCRHGQGFLFSHPLPAKQFQAWYLESMKG